MKLVQRRCYLFGKYWWSLIAFFAILGPMTPFNIYVHPGVIIIVSSPTQLEIALAKMHVSELSTIITCTHLTSNETY